MSSRPSFWSLSLTIAAFAAALAVAGCTRESAPASQGQANSAAPANLALPENGTPGPHREGELVVNDVIGMLDRSHHGMAAPTAGFLDPAGHPTTLAALAGRPVLVNLWATWCAPCVRELPTLDRVAQSVRVVTISQDLGAGSATQVSQFLASRHLTNLPAYRDPQVNLSMAYGGASLPMSILFDSTGHEVWRMTGGMDWTTATARELLAEGR